MWVGDATLAGRGPRKVPNVVGRYREGRGWGKGVGGFGLQGGAMGMPTPLSASPVTARARAIPAAFAARAVDIYPIGPSF